MAVMRILLVVGADGAPFAHELGQLLEPDDELTVVAPTVRGHVAAGLQASPDLDGLLTPTTPATYAVADALEAVGYTPTWQRASDQAVAARLVRTELVADGNRPHRRDARRGHPRRAPLHAAARV